MIERKPIQRIQASDEAACAKASCCYPVGGAKSLREKWIAANDLFVSDAGRVYALVDTERAIYFMDATTGSLYDAGSCLSSTNLRVSGLRRNPDAEYRLSVLETA